ncbi:unnamed protein product [Phytomonas sp. Hart1]|nr:unnamed protein product [Phytomonas sp. Hart1]|eukprot:CCW68613.1 unnamed protein product [Phytomonas sp. isolate Hart1]
MAVGFFAQLQRSWRVVGDARERQSRGADPARGPGHSASHALPPVPLTNLGKTMGPTTEFASSEVRNDNVDIGHAADNITAITLPRPDSDLYRDPNSDKELWEISPNSRSDTNSENFDFWTYTPVFASCFFKK